MAATASTTRNVPPLNPPTIPSASSSTSASGSGGINISKPRTMICITKPVLSRPPASGPSGTLNVNGSASAMTNTTMTTATATSTAASTIVKVVPNTSGMGSGGSLSSTGSAAGLKQNGNVGGSFVKQQSTIRSQTTSSGVQQHQKVIIQPKTTTVLAPNSNSLQGRPNSVGGGSAMGGSRINSSNTTIASFHAKSRPLNNYTNLAGNTTNSVASYSANKAIGLNSGSILKTQTTVSLMSNRQLSNNNNAISGMGTNRHNVIPSSSHSISSTTVSSNSNSIQTNQPTEEIEDDFDPGDFDEIEKVLESIEKRTESQPTRKIPTLSIPNPAQVVNSKQISSSVTATTSISATSQKPLILITKPSTIQQKENNVSHSNQAGTISISKPPLSPTKIINLSPTTSPAKPILPLAIGSSPKPLIKSPVSVPPKSPIVRIPTGCSIPHVVDMALISPERFSIYPYDKSLEPLFNSEAFPEIELDQANSYWTLPLTRYVDVVNALRAIVNRSQNITSSRTINLGQYESILWEFKKNPHFKGVQLLPKHIVSAFITHPVRFDGPNLDLSSKIPRNLLSTLMEFQRDGVVFGIRRGGRVLIGDEMGLGKTLQGLAIASYYKTEWPLLVICPSSLRFHWREQFVKWLGIPESEIALVLSAKDNAKGLVTIVSYDLAAKMETTLNGINFGVVIADESHFIKNGKSKRSRAIVPLLSKIRRAILLSGTPALAKPIELYTQLTALEPHIFPARDRSQFAYRYCNAYITNFGGLDCEGASNLAELHCYLGATVMIRRLKAEVLNQLPPKTRQQVYLQVPLKFSKVVKRVLAELKEARGNLKGDKLDYLYSKMEHKNLLLEAYHDTGVIKVPAVSEYIVDLLEQEGNKIIVFAHHKNVIESLCKKFERESLDYIRIDGSTPSHLRQEFVNRYQASPSCRIAILSITAAGCGLTLTAANIVIFAELFWTPGNLIQAEDRAHRIGQQNSVDIRYLLAPGTLDDYLWDMIEHKLEVVGRTINGQEDSMNAAAVEATTKLSEDLDQEDSYLNQVLDNVVNNYDQRRIERKQKYANIVESTYGAVPKVHTEQLAKSRLKNREKEDFDFELEDDGIIMDGDDDVNAFEEESEPVVKKKRKWIEDDDNDDNETLAWVSKERSKAGDKIRVDTSADFESDGEPITPKKLKPTPSTSSSVGGNGIAKLQKFLPKRRVIDDPC